MVWIFLLLNELLQIIIRFSGRLWCYCLLCSDCFSAFHKKKKNTQFLIFLQANKEKISFGRLEVREIAAFVLNSAGDYEAINRNCPNYYLSKESVALFVDHLPNRPSYIIGQIVHIERQSVQARPSRGSPLEFQKTPYGLPVGSDYFIVTVAMLPDTGIHSQPPSWSLQKWRPTWWKIPSVHLRCSNQR